MHEQDKQECTEKTAAKQTIQGSGRVRDGLRGDMLWDNVKSVVAGLVD